MKWQHENLAAGRWHLLPLTEQMANIGSEVIRALNWRAKGDKEYSEMALSRAMELLDLTISSPANLKRLKEIARIREIIKDFFYGDNQYNSSCESLTNYFMAFNYYIAIKKEKNGAGKHL